MNQYDRWTEKGEAATIPATDPTDSTLPNLDNINSAYGYGISLEEQEGMASFLKLLASAFQSTPSSYLSRYTPEPHIAGQPALPESFYPGKILKKVTSEGAGTKSWTFKFGQIWDIAAYGTATDMPQSLLDKEVPQWVRDTAGQSLNTYSVPTTNQSSLGPGYGSPLNGQYTSDTDGAGEWYESVGIKDLRDNVDGLTSGETQTLYGLIGHKDLVDVRKARPLAADMTTLRWVTIKNQSIGPWKGFMVRHGHTAWKLIDPAYVYDSHGNLTNQHRSVRYDRRTDPAYVRSRSGTYTDSDGEGLGIQNPHRRDLLETRGITIGSSFKDPSFFGLSPTTLNRNNQPVQPNHLNGDDNPWVGPLLQRATNLLEAGMPYLSLLDFDLLSIKKILTWEKAQITTEYPNLAAEDMSTLNEDYNRWITLVDDIINKFKGAFEGRQRIASLLLEDIAEFGVSRRTIADPSTPSETNPNPGKSFENGNFIQEYYIRVEELDYQGMPFRTETFVNPGRSRGDPGPTYTVEGVTEIFDRNVQQDPKQEFRRNIEEAKWRNSNYVDLGGRTEFLKGVVNIEEFQDYINSRFDSSGEVPANVHADYQQLRSADCLPTPLTKALITDLTMFEECGEAQAAELGVSVSPDRDEFVLGDFFKSVHVGLRISYVNPIVKRLNRLDTRPAGAGPVGHSTTVAAAARPIDAGDFGCWRYHEFDIVKTIYKELKSDGFIAEPFSIFPVSEPFADIAINSPKTADAALYQKAFFVSNGGVRAGDSGGARLTPAERDILVSGPFDQVANVIPLVCSEIPIDLMTPMSDVAHKQHSIRTTARSFFDFQYKLKHKGLIEQLKSSSEYEALFRYLFPVDRMLALNNIYGSEYLRSYKGINELFDPTKFRLKDLFFSLYNSGNYESTDCGPSNLDLQLGAMNGIPWGGLAATILLMMVKTVVLIFRGFVEAFDTNIAVSKMIRDGIHLANQMIAQAQVMANQAQQLGDAAGALGEGLGGAGGDACGPNSPSVPRKPPDDWFDPIDENFIPEPQIMFISLALLPITLLPLFWPGIPITPFGLAYWGMDWRPEPNWLNSMPPSDWLDKLLNEDSATAGPEMGGPSDEDCDINVGMPPLEPGDT